MKEFFKKIVFLFITFFIFPFFIYGEEMGQRWVCLNAKPHETNGHAAIISVDPKNKLLPNSKTYIFECLSNSYCTSGNSEVDIEVFKKDSLKEMANVYGYVFEGTENLSSNPILSNQNGEINTFVWKSSTPQSQSRRWLGLNYFSSKEDLDIGNEKTQQIGDFKLENAFSSSDCTSISWDPYGRVFDSITLEPLSNIKITLLKKRENNNFDILKPNELLGGNIINPQITSEDGSFSFFVPDNTYKLIAENDEYIFPEKINDINKNYLKIYSDIYPDQTGEEIIQKGSVQHRDIPLKPKTKSQDNKSKLIEFFSSLEKNNSNLYIKGRVSHPFSKIHFYSLIKEENTENLKRKTLLKTINADKLGVFFTKINQTDFSINEFFGDIVVEKVNLTKNLGKKEVFFTIIKEKFLNLFNKKVKAQTSLTSSYRFSPILNYIEGYAYDSNGKIISNGEVFLILEFSNKPSYSVKTDENGYFKIDSRFIPPFPYKIEYKNKNGEKTTLSTSKFIAQNKDIINKEKINLNKFKQTAKNIQKPTITNSDEKNEKKINFTKLYNNINNKIDNNNKQNNLINEKKRINNFLITIIIIFVLLFSSLILVFLYFKKNKNI